MTRTERSLSPRAIIKDRSESKSGMDKGLRKGGAGSHNWGNINDEILLETGALDDDQESVAKKEESADKPELTRRSSATSEEDRTAAREVRKRALKDGIDLASIARSSAAVSSA